ARGAERGRLKPDWGVGSRAFPRDGKLLAATSQQEVAKDRLPFAIWEVATGRKQEHESLRKVFERSQQSRLILCPNFQYLAVRYKDWRVLHVLNVTTGEQRTLEDVYPDDMAFSPDGQALAVVRGSSVSAKEYTPAGVRLCDVTTLKELSVLHRQNSRIDFLAFSPDGGTLAVLGSGRRGSFWGGKDYELTLWD